MLSLLLLVRNIIYHAMKDIIGTLTTSKLPVAKATKPTKSTPSKLSTRKSTVIGVMTMEGRNNTLSNNAIHS